MKTMNYGIILMLIILSGAGYAQDTPLAAMSEATLEQRHQELRDLRATMERALNERDLETIVAHVTDEVVFTTMNGDVVRGPEGIRAYFEKMMTGPGAIVESITSSFVADDLSIFLKDDVAIAFGYSDDHYVLTNGMVFDIRARWSGTMVRREDQWKIASFHYSANVFDNPILDAQRRTLLRISAIVALVVLVLGFIAGRKSARGRTP